MMSLVLCILRASSRTQGQVPVSLRRGDRRDGRFRIQSGLREPSRFSSEGKFSLSNVHPCLLHLSDGFQHVIVRLAGHFGNLE